MVIPPSIDKGAAVDQVQWDWEFVCYLVCIAVVVALRKVGKSADKIVWGIRKRAKELFIHLRQP
jgi:hypothetical protein